MKKFVSFIAAALWAVIPAAAQTPSINYSALAGVSFATSAPATATQVSGAVPLPTFSGVGTLNITESGITGSPSGCSVKLAYQQRNATTATSAVVTQAFTPATGVQQFAVAPSIVSGDAYVATYACSSTYPTAGLISISFSPSTASVSTVSFAAAALDPCQNPNVAKSSVIINVSSATTTSLVAVSGSTSVYVCGAVLNAVGTSPSVQLEYGTSTSCTGTHALTGSMIPSATVGTINLGYGGTVVSAPSANGVCLVSAGTVTSVSGVLTYVQQ